MIIRSEVEIDFYQILSKYIIAEEIEKILDSYNCCKIGKNIEVVVPILQLTSYVKISEDVIDSSLNFGKHHYYFREMTDEDLEDENLENFNSITLCMKLWHIIMGEIPIATFTFFYKEKIC